MFYHNNNNNNNNTILYIINNINFLESFLVFINRWILGLFLLSLSHCQNLGLKKYILLCFPKMQTPTFYIFLLDEKFEILTVGLHSLYVLNTHVKFRSNRILFIIQSINLFLCIILDPKNLKFKHLINYITINFLYS